MQSKIAQSNILQSIGLVDHHLSNRYVFIMPYLHASNSRQPNLPSWVMLYTLLLGLVWCYVKWFKGGFFCGGDSQCSDILVRSLEDSLHKGPAIALTIVADWKRKRRWSTCILKIEILTSSSSACDWLFDDQICRYPCCIVNYIVL